MSHIYSVDCAYLPLCTRASGVLSMPICRKRFISDLVWDAWVAQGLCSI